MKGPLKLRRNTCPGLDTIASGFNDVAALFQDTLEPSLQTRPYEPPDQYRNTETSSLTSCNLSLTCCSQFLKKVLKAFDCVPMRALYCTDVEPNIFSGATVSPTCFQIAFNTSLRYVEEHKSHPLCGHSRTAFLKPSSSDSDYCWRTASREQYFCVRTYLPKTCSKHDGPTQVPQKANYNKWAQLRDDDMKFGHCCNHMFCYIIPVECISTKGFTRSDFSSS